MAEQIGRYEIREVAGRGGMSTVYRAFDPRFRREVAVKVMTGELLDDETLRERFTREARIIAALEHPAIVPVYDFGEDDLRPYLVMRLMSGGTLADRLRNGPLSFEETAEVLLRIGSALERAHEEGVIHRDLKPSNIMFDQYGDAYLADFGIARLTTGAVTLTGDNVVGTPAYMSPEQIHGEREIDSRTDIYALGVICFEMLTGQRPFRETEPMRLMMQHLLDPVPDIRTVRPDLPAGLETVITHSMAKSPDDRYRSATELTDTLASLVGISRAARMASEAAQVGPAPETPADEVEDGKAPAAVEAVDETIPDSGDLQPRPLPDDAPAAPLAEATAEAPPSAKRRRLWLAGGLAALLLLIAGGYILLAGRPFPGAEGWAEGVRVTAQTEAVAATSETVGQTETVDGAEQAAAENRASAQIQPTVEALLERFYAGMEVEDFGAAEEAINNALALAPDQAQLHAEKATLMAAVGDYDLALSEIGAATELAPEDGQYHSFRGDLLMEVEGPQDALDSHLQAVRVAPEDPYVHMSLGDNYMALERPDEAIDQYTQAVALKGDEAWFYDARANAYFMVGDYDRGLADLEEASALEPGERGFFTQAGDIFLYDLEDPERALEFYQRAVERTPDDGWVYADRAMAYQAMGDVDAALADLQHAIELGPERSTFYIRRAKLFLDSLEDREAALADLNHAVDADPQNPDAYAERAAFFQYYAEEPEAALEDRTRALELDPEGPWRYADRALVYRALERDDEALADLDRCLAIDPAYYWCWWERGWLFDSFEERKEAAASFQRFLELVEPEDCLECQAEAEQYVQDNG